MGVGDGESDLGVRPTRLGMELTHPDDRTGRFREQGDLVMDVLDGGPPQLVVRDEPPQTEKPQGVGRVVELVVERSQSLDISTSGGPHPDRRSRRQHDISLERSKERQRRRHIFVDRLGVDTSIQAHPAAVRRIYRSWHADDQRNYADRNVRPTTSRPAMGQSTGPPCRPRRPTGD